MVADVCLLRGFCVSILYNIRFMQNGSLARLSRRRRRLRSRKSRFLPILRNAFLLLCFASILGVAILFASFAHTYTVLAEDMPDLDDYASTELAQTSVVYDANGKVVEQLYGVQNRFVVSLDEIDPTLQEAVIAIEDHRFYEHRGLDFAAIGRAAVEICRASPSRRAARP
jgi:penicillin-binding protein 1A